MKFKIKEETKGDEVELWLEEEYDCVCLLGRDKVGTIKTIMTLRDGMFYRNISADLLGMKTSRKRGTIIEKDGN